MRRQLRQVVDRARTDRDGHGLVPGESGPQPLDVRSTPRGGLPRRRSPAPPTRSPGFGASPSSAARPPPRCSRRRPTRRASRRNTRAERRPPEPASRRPIPALACRRRRPAPVRNNRSSPCSTAVIKGFLLPPSTRRRTIRSPIDASAAPWASSDRPETRSGRRPKRSPWPIRRPPPARRA